MRRAAAVVLYRHLKADSAERLAVLAVLGLETGYKRGYAGN